MTRQDILNEIHDEDARIRAVEKLDRLKITDEVVLLMSWSWRGGQESQIHSEGDNMEFAEWFAYELKRDEPFKWYK